MKKLIFLLLAVIFAGFVSAQDAAYPPGVLINNMSDTIEAALYGDSEAYGLAVTPGTVLAVLPVMAELSSCQAVMERYNDKAAMQPQSGTIPVINTGQFGVDANYHLRL